MAQTPTLRLWSLSQRLACLGPSNDKSYTESNSYMICKEPEKAAATNRSATIKTVRPRRDRENPKKFMLCALFFKICILTYQDEDTAPVVYLRL